MRASTPQLSLNFVETLTFANKLDMVNWAALDNPEVHPTLKAGDPRHLDPSVPLRAEEEDGSQTSRSRQVFRLNNSKGF